MSETAKGERFGFITLAQCLGCILVILGHSYVFVSPFPQALEEFRNFLYCFHMPLFVWCSGYLLVKTNQTERYPVKQFAVRRARRLLLPYLIFSLIGFAPKILFSKYLNDSMSLTAEGIARAFLVPRSNIWGHFWFLPMIFILGLLGFLLAKFLGRYKAHVIPFCLLALVVAYTLSRLSYAGDEWFGVADVLRYSWLFVLGMGCGFSATRIPQKIQFILIPVGIALAVVTYCVGYRHAALFVKDAIAILMLLSLLSLMSVLSKSWEIPRGSLLTQTFAIFILSWPCQLVIEVLLERILHLQWFMVMPAMAITGLVAPICILWLIDCLPNNALKRFAKTALSIN